MPRPYTPGLGSFGQIDGGLLAVRVEPPDGSLATRERAPLVMIERRGARDCAFIQRCSGKEIAARTSHARDIDCRPGDG